MVTDYEQGPERSRAEHFTEQWTRLVIIDGRESEEETIARARELEAAAYSIRIRVQTQAEFLRLVLDCRERFGDAFDIEASAQQAIEFVVVLRKRGALPPPAPDPVAAPPPSLGARIVGRLQREARAIRQRRG